MAAVLIVHDDSVISRTAYLLEERKRRIRLYESILLGDPMPEEYHEVSKDYIRQELKNERWLLDGLIEDIQDWLFDQELQQISREYVTGSREAEG